MELITKDLLINVLFILLPVLLMQMFYLLKYIYRLKKLKESWFLFFPLISMILCMLFPFSLGSGLTWDLRSVPFLLGMLYGGPKYRVCLLSLLLMVRYLIGGTGFYISACTFGTMAILTTFLSSYYLKLNLKHKLVLSGLLVFVLTFITFVASIQIAEVNLTASMWIQYFVINVVGMLIATALWEVIQMNFEVLQKLMKAEKLEVVSNLAASISHEVRNPLTTSRGFMQLSYEGDIPPETKEHILISIQELDRATEIINDYLTFAKPAPEQKENIIIYEEIHHVINLLTPLANMNNVKIGLRIEKNEGHYILGERKKLEQALVNIVKNGIESMHDGGKLEVGIDYCPHILRINIRDQGKGMTRKQIDRLGEPYFTTKEKGTGLGMMVSFSIIQGMGGKITVKSEIEKGTCFSIEFPIANV
ncbi:ATP-binding protein [Domibacillus sp. A3M-37]|uniref:ATP-binding protein n=1 Tax=Domibacillus sp. A3M-37 TaxID=2962037 RepID=UPI0020B8B234|nr:ATP-binding protein [Domibacillus sp. A3M-37]MCP3764661.1 ATP-binding protein [Domibacillus sp. A3M-37]